MGQEITQADRARLLLNTVDLSNRWVDFGELRYPILHLSIGDLERFRAVCTPIEELYLEFSKSELPFIDFISVYRDEILEIFQNNVPDAASIVLRLPTTKIVAVNRPLEAFHAILHQWVHNLELGWLHTAFPAPESDFDEEVDVEHQNPLSTVQKLMSAYHCSFEDAISRTTPQVYLMGVDAAWAYENIKKDKPKKLAMPKQGTQKMTAAEFKEYLTNIQAQGVRFGVMG